MCLVACKVCLPDVVSIEIPEQKFRIKSRGVMLACTSIWCVALTSAMEHWMHSDKTMPVMRGVAAMKRSSQVASLVRSLLSWPNVQQLAGSVPSSVGQIQAFWCELMVVVSWHCRPDYKKLGVLKQQFPDVPIMALTATATQRVCDDLKTMLRIEACESFSASVNRPNLLYEVKCTCT